MNQHAMLSVSSLRTSPLLGSKTSTPFTLTWNCPGSAPLPSTGRMSMSGSPKMTKRFPLPVFFKSSAMCRSAFMRALRMGTLPSLLNSVAWAS